MINEGFLDNVACDPRLVGLETLLAPFAAHTSSQRLAMLSSHANQALVLHGGEPPRVGTGFESMIGEYEFDPTKREQDIQILAIIPKYIIGTGAFPIRNNPTITVIYRGNSDGKVNYFHLNTFTKCMDGYGYENKWQNTHYLSVGNYVPRDVKFTSSPIHKGNFYSMGTNANTAYMSLDGVTKDAFIISESLAKKLNSSAIKTIDFKVSPEQIPLNLYGNDMEYRFMPDIGEQVREDGLLCCFRKPTDDTFISDTMGDALSAPQILHDLTYVVPYNATIMDITIDINRNYKNRIPENIYTQMIKYKESINQYYLKIIEAYQRAVADNTPISSPFNTLVTDAYAMLLAEGIRVPGFNKRMNISLMKKKDPIEFMHISVTYMYDNVVANGYKISDRQGGLTR